MVFSCSCRFHRLRASIFALGFVAIAGFLTSLTQGSPSQQSKLTAVELMECAHNGRAVWNSFPGFRADVHLHVNGTSTVAALSVSSAGEIDLSIPEGETWAWARSSIRSLVSHRLSADEAIRDVAYADDQETHPLGRLLRSTNESDKSLWRVQGDVMTEVHRQHGKSRFIISVTDVARNAEGKHLPKSFDVVTWDVELGHILSSRQVAHEWKRFGSVDLPLKLTAAISKNDGTRRVEQIEFSNHQLLSETRVSAKP